MQLHLGQCHEALGQYESARQAFQHAFAALDQCGKTTLQESELIRAGLVRLEKKAANTRPVGEGAPKRPHKGRGVQEAELVERNSWYPSLGAVLRPAHSPVRGRHVLATADISPGKIHPTFVQNRTI